LVDEYQDTNHSQYLIIKALASKFENICVVGDDAQSIYSFRGANIYNILNFEKDYPNVEKVSLEQNYRSTRMIVDAANSVIARNINQFPKNVFSENEEGDKIKIYRALSDADEASFVATNIWDLHLRDKRRFSDIAVLYRTNSQTRAIEDALRKKNIPYKVYGGLSFYQRKEVKDLMAYLRILVNDNDNEALIRVINYPTRGIGETTQNKLIVFADSIDLPLSKVLDNISFYSSQLGLNNSVINKLNDFWQMIQAFRVMLKTENAYNVTMEVAKRSGLLRVLKEDQTPEGVSRIENIQEVMNSLQGFIEEQQQLDDGDPSLSNFLENIALSTDTEKKDEEDGDRVSLMTIHLSKGLEFPVVHLVGLEENLFPSIMSSNTRDELEEERRLFYVALTRAEKQIFLSYATFRYQWGKNTSCEPSRFIIEVDSHYLDFLNPNIERKVINRSGLKSNIFDETPSTPNTFRRLEPKKKIIRPINTTQNEEIVSISNAKITNGNGNIQEIQVGDKVRHDRFGVGEVILIDGTDPENIKAKIDFANEGKKNLILKFAKLYKI
jgi:ATP-dependent DNA helicase pcrA